MVKKQKRVVFNSIQAAVNYADTQKLVTWLSRFTLESTLKRMGEEE